MIDALPESLIDKSGLVIAGVPCEKCSYELRGLSVEGRCPECGGAIEASVRESMNLLRYADPSRSAKQLVGCVLMLLAVFGAGVFHMAAPFLGDFEQAYCGDFQFFSQGVVVLLLLVDL